MDGVIEVSYTIMCKKDLNKEISIQEILKNEKVMKSIKSEFASGMRNLVLLEKEGNSIFIKTEKEIHTFRVEKNDFADILELAEEHAKEHKLYKKECAGVELVDIVTLG